MSMSISLDEQQYRPGSVVRGRLTLRVDHPFHPKYIRLNAVGSSRFKIAVSPLEECAKSEKYLDLTFCLWKRNESLKDGISPGLHEFPFEFTLPFNVPSSFKGRYGQIQYTITVWSPPSNKLSKGTGVSINLPILRDVPILYPSLQARHYAERDVSGGLFKFSGQIKFTVEVPRTGFLVGEVIPVSGRVVSTSTSNVRLYIYLFQHVKYNKDGYKSAATNQPLLSIPAFKHRGRGQTTWTCSSSLRIPNTVVPSGSTSPCAFIDVQYSIKVVLYVSGTAKSDCIVIPITVGSVYNGASITFNQQAASFNPVPLPLATAYPTTQFAHPSLRVCESMPLPDPAQRFISHMEGSSATTFGHPRASLYEANTVTASSISDLHRVPTGHFPDTGSLPCLSGDANGFEFRSLEAQTASNDLEVEQLPPSYDELFPV